MILCIIQARMGSTRLPGKVMKPLAGTTAIKYMLDRVSQSNAIDKIVVATSDKPENKPLIEHLSEYETYAGDENNVLSRFHTIAQQHSPSHIIRLTADCPLICPTLIDYTFKQTVDNLADYGSNVNPATFPDGLDVEVFTLKLLNDTHRDASNPHDLEHVTPHMQRNTNIKHKNVSNPTNLRHIRWTLDTQEDLHNIQQLAQVIPSNIYTWQELLAKSTQ